MEVHPAICMKTQPQRQNVILILQIFRRETAPNSGKNSRFRLLGSKTGRDRRPLRFGRGRAGGGQGLQQLFLAVDQRVGVVGGDFKIVAVGNGVAGAGFHAIAAEDAAVVVDVVNLGVALRGADAVVAGILRRLDVDAIGRAGRGAQEAGDALLQAIFIAAQNVDAAIAGFKMRGLDRDSSPSPWARASS